ncbi:MAG: ABC transporter permease [bacterium]|nr:ABC transporter permease [bacterium]
MSRVLSIAGKELRVAFVSPLLYVFCSSFLILCGVFFFGIVEGFQSVVQRAATDPAITPNLNEWVVLPYLRTVEVILLFLLPLLTMRSLAEERSSGAFELLITSPVSALDIVIGKYLGLAASLLLPLSLAFMFPLALLFVATPELLPILLGFLGVGLFVAAYLALGLACSAFTSSSAVAGIVSLVLFLLLYVADAPSGYLGGNAAEVLHYLSPATHGERFYRGVLLGSDLLYYSSLVGLGLFLSVRAIEGERWR